METTKKKRVSMILLFIFLIPVFFVSVRLIYSNKPISEEINNGLLNKNRADVNPLNINDDKAPELKNQTGKWINTDKEITLENLKGKVVLIEFWTFGCYNCVNTLPYLKEWYEKYKSDNFETIGIHCPEFDNERNFENVKSNVEKLGIKYPVLTDNEFSIWQKYDVNAWPTIVLIDKNGDIRYKKIGEGNYDKTEQKINELLKVSYSGENGVKPE